MKKLFSTLIMLTAFSFCAFAGSEPDTNNSDVSSFIVTDCGTVHQISDKATNEERAALLDKYTVEDCLYGGF